VKRARLAHEFVEYVPEQLNDGVLYVSMSFAVASHRCACGCGREVVTPLSPTDWQLLFDGEGVSLQPSIGNWNFPCRSHYWIRRGAVQWATDMPQSAIEQGRVRDRLAKARYLASKASDTHEPSKPVPETTTLMPIPDNSPRSWWDGLPSFFGGKRKSRSQGKGE
jgi:hypothetical protein